MCIFFAFVPHCQKYEKLLWKWKQNVISRLALSRPAAYVFASTFFIGRLVGLGPKFLDNGSPRNFHASLVWGQTLKPTFEKFFSHP